MAVVLAGAAIACRAGSAAGEGVAVSLEDAGGGAYHLAGSFSVNASSVAAWGVLTDYDEIESFVSSMWESRVRSRGSTVLVEQIVVGRAMLLSRRVRVLLEIVERPIQRISFRDVSGRDFERYSGEWTINDSAAGVRIDYRLDAKPAIRAPHFLMKGIIRRNVAALLAEVRAEIVRRAAAGEGRRSRDEGDSSRAIGEGVGRLPGFGLLVPPPRSGNPEAH